MMKAKHKPLPPELQRRVDEELQSVLDYAGYRSTGIPEAPARVILIDILSREVNGQISEVTAFKLIEAFIEACMGAADDHRLTRDSIESLWVEIRAKRARDGKDANSKIMDGIIWHHTGKEWEKNPKMRRSALGTAGKIADAVNVALAANNLKKLGVQAIRKRIQKLKVGTAA